MPSFIFNNLLASFVLLFCFLTCLGLQGPAAYIRALPVGRTLPGTSYFPVFFRRAWPLSPSLGAATAVCRSPASTIMIGYHERADLSSEKC